MDGNRFNNGIRVITYLLILNYATWLVSSSDIYTIYTSKLKEINIILDLLI